MTLKIGDTLDLLKIAVLNFAPEVSNTAPSTPGFVGQMWTDTSTLGPSGTENAIARYWDGHRWARMDGGGDIPDGMIENRHIADDAAIDWSKINAPALGTAADITAINSQLTALDGRVSTLEGSMTTAQADISALKLKDTALDGDITNLRSDITAAQGDISDLQDNDAVQDGAIQGLTDDVGQNTSDITALTTRVTTDEANLVITNNAVSALTGRVTAAEGVNTTQDGRLDALEEATQDINVATQDELNALSARVTTAEGDITTLEADMTAAEAAITAEVDRSSAEDTAIRADFAAADTGLGSRIDDEIDARTAADGVNASAISAETSRATAAEEALDTRVGDLEAVDNLTQAEFGTFEAANTAALALKADLVGGLVPKSQLPSIALVDVNVVADAAARDALTVDEGDIAILQDGGGTFIYDGTDWVPLASGADAATDAEVAGAVADEAALRIAADNALDARLDTLEGIDYATQAELDAQVDLLEDADTANADALATEVSRATDAEAALDGRITDEVADRTDADALIRTDFAAADTALNDAIEAEVTRATGAEGTLTTNLATEVSDREAADAAIGTRIGTVEGNLATEVTDRTNADATLRTDFEAADTALTTAVNLRALDADVVHLAGIETITGVKTFDTGATPKVVDAPTLSTEVANKAYVDSKAAGAVYDDSALVTRIGTAETDIAGLKAADIAETNARTSADALMAGRLDVIEDDASTPGSIANAVAGEASARSTADAALQTNITAEANNRAAADSTLQGLINDEVATRLADDNTIRGEFAAADTAVRGEFAAADTAVRGEFAAADTLLQADIDDRALDSAVVHNTGDEDVDGVKTFSASPVVPVGAANGDAVNKGQLDAAIAAASSAADLTALEGRVTTIEGGDAGDSMREVADDAITLREATVANEPGNLVVLDAGGKVPSTQLPALALTDVRVVADQAGLTGLTDMEEGDVAIVQDSDGDGTRQTYIYDGTAWVELSSPADVTEEELAAAVDAGLEDVNLRIDGLGAGAGLTKTGDTFDVGGTADRITVTADAVDIAATYAGQDSITTLGVVGTGTWQGDKVAIEYGGTGLASGTTLADLKAYLGITTLVHPFAQDLPAMVIATPTIVSHNLGTEDITYSVRIVATGEFIEVGVVSLNENSISVTTGVAFAAGELRIVIHG